MVRKKNNLIVSKNFINQKFNITDTEKAIGKIVKIFGQPFNITGIIDPQFDGLTTNQVDFWLPDTHANLVFNMSSYSDKSYFSHLVLPYTYSIAIISKDVNDHFLKIQSIKLSQYLNQKNTITSSEKIIIHDGISLNPKEQSKQKRRILVLIFAAFIILVIVLINVARYRLFDLTEREKELNTRIALGASHETLYINSFTEITIFLLCSLLLSFLFTPVINNILMQGIEINYANNAFEYRQMVTTIISITLITMIFMFLLEFLQLRSIFSKDIRQGLTGKISLIKKHFLFISQIAVSICALYYLSQMLFSYQQLSEIDLGINAKDVFSLPIVSKEVSSKGSIVMRYPADSYMHAIRNTLKNDNIKNIAFSSFIPFSKNSEPSTQSFSISNLHIKPMMLPIVHISDNFFDLLGIPILSGRTFVKNEKNVIMVNEAFVKQYLNSNNPVNRIYKEIFQMTISSESATMNNINYEPLLIVGVVSDSYFQSRLITPKPLIFIPLTDTSELHAVLIRTNKNLYQTGLSNSIKDNVPIDQKVLPIEDMEEAINNDLKAAIGIMSLLLFAIILSAVLLFLGIYSTALQYITDKQKDIAIKLAVGSSMIEIYLDVIKYFSIILLYGMIMSLLIVAISTNYIADTINVIYRFDFKILLVIALFIIFIFLLGIANPLLRLSNIGPWQILKMD